MLITVIGRGHSGTRLMSHTLTASGVFMGKPRNLSGDLLPPRDLYDACVILARHVSWRGGMEWDFSRVHAAEIPPGFSRRVLSYLRSVLESPAQLRGWKIPETTLAYPWIRRMFPEVRYIFWTRDPRDCIIGSHITDDLRDWGVPHQPTDDVRLQRATSWMYHNELVKSTPRPAHWIEVRYEDFVLHQQETLARLEAFLGFPLARIPVHREAIGRWKTDSGKHDFPCFDEALARYGYARPARTA